MLSTVPSNSVTLTDERTASAQSTRQPVHLTINADPAPRPSVRYFWPLESNDKKVVSIRFKPAGRVGCATSWSSDTPVVGHIVILQPTACPVPKRSTTPKPFSQPTQTSFWTSPLLTSTTATKRASLVPYRFHLSRNARMTTATCLFSLQNCYFLFNYNFIWTADSSCIIIDLASDLVGHSSVKRCALLSSLKMPIF